MPREERKKIIKEIERKRKSKVISYITSDRFHLNTPITGDVVPIIHEHLLSIPFKERTKLDLFLYSRGGESDVPWTLVSMFREYCEKGSFCVLLPYRAHSAATVISLGADEIIMTKKAELGPIDITLARGPYNPADKISNQRLPVSVEDVMGYFALLEKLKCKEPTETLKGFEILSEQVHPLVLGNVNRLLEQTKLVALRLLGTRSDPFDSKKNEDIITKLSTEIYSHNHTINRTEARNYLGLEQVINAENEEINEEMWNLYEEYKDLFQFEQPFIPEEYLIEKGLDEYTWDELNLACIESLGRYDICKRSERVRRLKRIPPQVNLNLNNLNLPAINIQQLPDGLGQQDVIRLVQNIVQSSIKTILDNAVKATTEEFMKSLPSAGFETTLFKGGWIKEE